MRSRLRTAAQWATLIALSALLVGGLELLRLPAALLIGALAAAAALTAFDIELHVSAPLFYAAQAIVGCLVARVVISSTMKEAASNWPTFLGGVLSVIAVSVALGWLLARLRILPGSTAIWGSFPGAATVMTLMADGYGADARLVALMQYLRVVMVVVAATAVAGVWTATTPHAPPPIVWFPPVAWPSLAATAALAIVSAAAGRALRIPAGPMLVAFGAGALMQNLGMMKIELPPWFLAPAYLFVGWTIGARFSRPILIHAAKVLPAVAASTLCLIAACAGLAAALAHFAHVDALTAYLATSPGGADSVAIIAASTKVDMPFIMAMQMARFLIVLIAGPAIARFVAARS
jgi:uncharacterized protein